MACRNRLLSIRSGGTRRPERSAEVKSSDIRWPFRCWPRPLYATRFVSSEALWLPARQSKGGCCWVWEFVSHGSTRGCGSWYVGLRYAGRRRENRTRLVRSKLATRHSILRYFSRIWPSVSSCGEQDSTGTNGRRCRAGVSRCTRAINTFATPKAQCLPEFMDSGWEPSFQPRARSPRQPANA